MCIRDSFRSNEIGVQNSIDPFYIEENGEKYLFWGSFRGIYYIELSEDGLHIRPGAKPTQIAGTAYEAVYVHKKGKYYYCLLYTSIIAQGLVSREDYELMEKYTYALFQRGTEIAAEKGLILVDTKYEFGKKNGRIYLIDEIHTPDSSRYFYAEGYEERFAKGEKQKQLSKEFVRERCV